jgi:hypothetical protein
MLEGRIDVHDPNFVDGEDLLKLEAERHASDIAPQDRSHCSGTMQLPEYSVTRQVRSHETNQAYAAWPISVRAVVEYILGANRTMLTTHVGGTYG